jgi:hypothetical protein
VRFIADERQRAGVTALAECVDELGGRLASAKNQYAAAHEA